MNERRIDGFFYGLFMDAGVLQSKGVAPVNPRKAYVDDFALRIGDRATLIPSAGARSYGMLYALTHGFHGPHRDASRRRSRAVRRDGCRLWARAFRNASLRDRRYPQN